MTGPLQGLRVVEMAGIGPGPFCAMLLSDMGADVIRIQSKGRRQAVPFLNTRFDVLARGRRSLAIDIKNPAGREAVLGLIERAEVLIEGYRPGVMERLGLGPQDCMARNPRLVYGRMTGWGQHGPLSPSAGHDINYLALSGVLHGVGRSGTPPPPLNTVADMGGGGMMLAFGLVCGVIEARRSHVGQVVDAAMADGSALLASMIYGFKAAGLWSNERGTHALDGGAHYYDCYECADGKFVAVGCIEPQFHRLLIDKLGLSLSKFEPQTDPTTWPAARALLAGAFKARTRDEWVRVFDGADVCVTPVLDWDEAPAHPHHRARETFIEVAGVVQPAPAPRFSRTVPHVARPPARADQDTDEVLRDWGFTQTEVSGLKAARAL